MGRYYILKDNAVVEEPDHSEWIKWYENSYEKIRQIAHTELKFGVVSTVFLALNMTLSKSDPPMVFETRVKGGWLDDEWERFSTLQAAKAGHEAVVARVREAEEEHELPPPGCPVW